MGRKPKKEYKDINEYKTYLLNKNITGTEEFPQKEIMDVLVKFKLSDEEVETFFDWMNENGLVTDEEMDDLDDKRKENARGFKEDDFNRNSYFSL